MLGVSWGAGVACEGKALCCKKRIAVSRNRSFQLGLMENIWLFPFPPFWNLGVKSLRWWVWLVSKWGQTNTFFFLFCLTIDIIFFISLVLRKGGKNNSTPNIYHSCAFYIFFQPSPLVVFPGCKKERSWQGSWLWKRFLAVGELHFHHLISWKQLNANAFLSWLVASMSC